jgi:hypothetical protein
LEPPPLEPLLTAGEALLAAGEALLAAVEALLEEQPATAMAAAPATMDMVSLREGIG